MSGLFLLKGQVKHYDWGGDRYLSKLLGADNPGHLPFAEYWMGIHPQGPAQLIDVEGRRQLLSEKESDLSYLLKVLDVRNMLSIQVHPNKQMAKEDYVREEQAGIPIDSPRRNYKDSNHKPELMVALSEFWLLHGFRSPESLKDLFDRYDFLHPLNEQWKNEGYEGLYRWVMERPQVEVNEILDTSLLKMVEKYDSGRLSPSDPCFWAARAHKTFSLPGRVDRGIFSIFLFNLFRLERGQGIFQGAGVPHAYLEGRNVEIMANSDNVLRGGLTAKHIDVPELLRHVRPEPVEPRILEPEAGKDGVRRFPVPVPDFSIESVELKAGDHFHYQADRSCILLLPEGHLQLEEEGGQKLDLGSPEISAYVAAGTKLCFRALTPAWLFIASGQTGGTD